MRLEGGVYVPVYVGEAVLLDVGVVLAVDVGVLVVVVEAV